MNSEQVLIDEHSLQQFKGSKLMWSIAKVVLDRERHHGFFNLKVRCDPL